jgi:hypothetical protein
MCERRKAMKGDEIEHIRVLLSGGAIDAAVFNSDVNPQLQKLPVRTTDVSVWENLAFAGEIESRNPICSKLAVNPFALLYKLKLTPEAFSYHLALIRQINKNQDPAGIAAISELVENESKAHPEFWLLPVEGESSKVIFKYYCKIQNHQLKNYVAYVLGARVAPALAAFVPYASHEIKRATAPQRALWVSVASAIKQGELSGMSRLLMSMQTGPLHEFRVRGVFGIGAAPWPENDYDIFGDWNRTFWNQSVSDTFDGYHVSAAFPTSVFWDELEKTVNEQTKK